MATRMKGERKSNVKINKPSSSSSKSRHGFLSFMSNAIFGQSIGSIILTAILIAVAAYGYFFLLKASSPMKNLMNADDEQLKDLFFGEKPYMIHCADTTEKLPKSFTDLHLIKGNKIRFAYLNCSHILPSGKSIWERFKLKSEWKPTYFGIAPWIKPIQVHPTQMKDTQALKKFIDEELAPKATVVKSDKALWQHCNFQKNIVYDDRDISETCILILKGSKFTSMQYQLEQRLVEKYPKVKFASADATKLRLSFEDLDTLPADHFAMKLHALRNGTHSMSMVHPATWDYLNTFVSQASISPLYDYTGEGQTPFQLMKIKDLQAKKQREEQRKFKNAEAQEKKKQKKSTSSTNTATGRKPKTAPRAASPTATTKTTTHKPSSSSSSKKQVNNEDENDLEVDEDDDETETAEEESESEKDSADDVEDSGSSQKSKEDTITEQLKRERARREEMERLEKEYLFESVDDINESETGSGDVEESNDDSTEEELILDEDSVIEL
jgi:hypothetical protein